MEPYTSDLSENSISTSKTMDALLSILCFCDPNVSKVPSVTVCLENQLISSSSI